MQKILDAILAGELGEVGHLPVPEFYRGVTLHADETTMFEGVASRDKDPRRSLHLEEVVTPEPAAGEVRAHHGGDVVCTVGRIQQGLRAGLDVLAVQQQLADALP